jgi:hypothetical protein
LCISSGYLNAVTPQSPSGETNKSTDIMRVSVPTIITGSGAPKQTISPAAAVERIADFLSPGKVTLLTGAGVSVASGIRAYRGKDGRYMNPNYQ